jgi:hypothetical protein
MTHPTWPIIYVRGYAMTRAEIDETSADPFCGFNLGSTVYRATTDKNKPAKFMFESPVLRLAADHGYACLFDGGLDVGDDGFGRSCIPPASIIIYRYYDEASRLLGGGKTPDIGKFGRDLGSLILKVKKLVCAQEQNPRVESDAFRCYLVAHSMGGLVCRAFLQDPDASDEARACVDKVFTYATPHNGIEMAGVNVPGWLGVNDVDNFNREKMARYLNLGAFYKNPETDRVDWLPQGPDRFKAEKFFCMIGTNRGDYEVAMGLSRTFAGHGSDGLVRIENASVWGIDAERKISQPCATAYAYRSHSGPFGIVNSEEAYQNLVRFLFGDVRVDIWLDIDAVRLPPKVEQQRATREVNALYQFEILASPRDCRWFLTRRTAEEDSVACRTLQQLESGDAAQRSVYLSTMFLSKGQRRKQVLQEKAQGIDAPNTLAYSVTLGVRVPDYEVARKLWTNEHYEGGYLFRDTSLIELWPPQKAADQWNITYAWQSRLGSGRNDIVSLAPVEADGKLVIEVPFAKPGAPGISGSLRFVASSWNAPG